MTHSSRPAATPASPGAQDASREILTASLDALDRLMKLFAVERVVHLVVGVLAFLMLLMGAILVVKGSGVDSTLLVTFFGSSGLIAISSARITYFFNRAFRLVEDLIRQLASTKGQP